MRKITALDIIKKIVLEIEQKKPTKQNMLDEIRLMKFKIRPIVGDITELKAMNNKVVELLWKIGRIDEIISDNFDNLEEDDQTVLLDYLKDLEISTEESMRDMVSIDRGGKKSAKKLLKIEVFKEIFDERVVN